MLSEYKYPCSNRRLSSLIASFLVLPLAAGSALAQEDGDDESIEAIVTVGSQIRGANIRDALAVSVVTAEDIESIGVDSGDELLEFMAEQGQNFFTDERASLSTRYFGYMADVNRDLPRSWYLDLRLDF